MVMLLLEITLISRNPVYFLGSSVKKAPKASKDRNLHKSHFYPQKRKPKIKADDDKESSSSKSTSTGSSYEKEPAIFW